MDIEKQQFKNNTGGFLGVTVIGPRGDDRGVAVEPEGTVWLSEQEQRLTANAPRQPKDNPFIEQTLERVNPQTGEIEEFKMTPLTPVSEDRFVPADLRPIPATTSAHAALMESQAAATADEPYTPTVAQVPALERHQEVERMGDDAKPNVPPPPKRAQQAAAAAQEPPSAPEPTPAQPPAAPKQQAAPKPQAPPQPPQETARAEEQGTPVSSSPQTPPGTYTAKEETGTPSAKPVGSTAGEPGGDSEKTTAQPAPYTPPQE